MDRIREFACELVMKARSGVSSPGVDLLILEAKKWEEYLRSPGVPPAEIIDTSGDEDKEEPVYDLTEEDVLEAMLGEHPEALDILQQAQGDVGMIETAAARILGDGE
jgi:hypothetical protein